MILDEKLTLNPFPALEIRNCLGNVHLEDCPIVNLVGAGASIVNAAAGTVAASGISAGQAFDQSSSGTMFVPQPGILMSNSNESLYDSTAIGSTGPNATPGEPPAPVRFDRAGRRGRQRDTRRGLLRWRRRSQRQRDERERATA